MYIRSCVKDGKMLLTSSVDRQDGRHIAAAIAVVWSRPDRDEGLVKEELEALLHELVRAADELYAVGLVKLLDSILAKEEPRAARRDAPVGDAVVGVGPQELAHGAVVRHLLLAVEGADVVEVVDARGEAAVDAEDLAVHERRERHVVEELRAVAPHVGVPELADALVVEAVRLRDLPALVVPPQQRDPVRVPHLERDEQQDRLHAPEPSVHKVPQEEVVRLASPHVPAAPEELQQVMELPVYVATDLLKVYVCNEHV